MFSTIKQIIISGGDEPVPEWSGQLIEMNGGLAIMRVHINDARQHLAPEGWRAIGHDTFDDGTFETYIFFKVSAE